MPRRGLRLIATVRSDFLARLAALPGLGDAVTRALYLLEPLSSHAVREAIVGPARVTGLRFESPALVDELVGSAGSSGGELPLLQFALAELWEARDVERGMLRASALGALGGVAGALARHADGVIGRLAPRERAVARAVLTALVTADGTRARRTAAELGAVGPGERRRRVAAVLEALVRGRLVTIDARRATASYQLAHEALVDGWDTLRGWLRPRRRAQRRPPARRARRRRVGPARPAAEALWRGRQLARGRRARPAQPRRVDARSSTRRARAGAPPPAPRATPRRSASRCCSVLGFAGARLAARRELDAP